ncbi:uncharacterized protein [Aegilops tauschii subsp. strangulata]|uniref:uncharacterized protein n=1 Tax=Aegilops tauschii subsp. strangulata TaxID=200361 RepID=UPI001ABC06E9|nr:uncharacterized protein LOC120969468 [Aegilops tauschii subsp. strangulata]
MPTLFNISNTELADKWTHSFPHSSSPLDPLLLSIIHSTHSSSPPPAPPSPPSTVTTSLATHSSIDGDGDDLLRSTRSRGGLHDTDKANKLKQSPSPQRSEMAGLEGFKFFEIVIEKSCSSQRLPDKFAKMLGGREPHKVKLREAGSWLRRPWDVLVVFDGEGHMYLGPGWDHFPAPMSWSSGTSLSSATTATPCSP